MNLHAQIPDIMERFDFEKVLRVMSFLNWRWRGAAPTMGDLRSTAMQLLDCAVLGYDGGPHSYSCATGGFVAQVETFKNAEPRLSLIFYVDHAEGRPG